MPYQKNECTIGVDLGGTKIEIALVDGAGSILAGRRQSSIAGSSPDQVIEGIAKAAQQCMEEPGRPAAAVGVGVAAQVEKGTGVVLHAPNLRWKNIPLRSRIETLLGLPSFIINDVNAVAYGEWRHGAGQGADDLVCLFVGTGIGGGVVCDGRLLEGHTNTAGELGHITVVADGRNCTCGGRGCVEAYAGGWAIAQRAQEEAEKDEDAASNLIKTAGSIRNITAKTVGEAYHNGDPLAVRLVQETASYLSAGVVGIVNAFNPEYLILGGGVVDGLPHLVGEVKKAVINKALTAASQGLTIVRASLGSQAGVVGAAAFAREKIQKTGS
jgi:glucokinase